MPDTNNVAPQGATPSSSTEEKRDITTNLITGKREDGSEIIELNLKPEKANNFIHLDPNGKITKDTHKNTKVDDIPHGGKVFPPKADGSKIFYFYDGYYLDLRKFLTEDDIDPDEVATKDMIKGFITQDFFTKTLDRYITVDSYNAKFLDYYTSADMDEIIKHVNEKLAALPDNAYSKREVQTLIDNIDTYTMRQLDSKLAEITSTIITNNNNWYKSLEGIARVNYVKDLLKPYVTTAFVENVQAGIAQQISEVNNKLGQFYTKTEVDKKNKNYLEEREIRTLLGDYVSNKVLQASIQDFVTNSTLSNSVSNLVSNQKLIESLQPYIKSSEVNSLLESKATKTSVNEVNERITSEVKTLEKHMINFVQPEQVTTMLESYITNGDLENKLVNIRKIFESYETIVSSDSKINNIKEEFKNEFRKYVKADTYDSEKVNYVSNLLFNSTTDEIRGLIKEKVTKDYVDNEINKLRQEYKSEVIKTITEDEVDNKLKSILETLQGMYNKVEINVIKTDIENRIADLKSYSDNTYVSKKDFNKELVKKADMTYVDNKITTVKDELDLDNRLSKFVTNDAIVSSLNDYPTRSQVNELLKQKTNEKYVDDKTKELENSIKLKIENTNNLIQANATNISGIESIFNQKTSKIISDQESVNNKFTNTLDNINNKFNDYQIADTTNKKIKDVKDSLDLKIDNLELKLTPKINSNTTTIEALKTEVSKKVTQAEINTAKDSLLDTINTTKSDVLSEVKKVSDKLPEYMKIEQFNEEKGLFINRSELSSLDGKVDDNKSELTVLINKNTESIKTVDNKKLSKEAFDEYMKNIYTKTELASKLLTFDDVFRKSEVTDFVNTLKASITNNTESIESLTTNISGRYVNKEIDDMIKNKYDLLNGSVTIILNRLDEKLESSKYKTDMAALNSNISNRPTYTELLSTIENNNKKFKSAAEITTALDTFRINFWNDLRTQFTNTNDMNNLLSNYTTLVKLKEELDKYATIEKLEAKILEVNGVTRSDVVSMITENGTKITTAYKQWINNLLETYITTRMLSDVLSEKVNVSDYEVRVKNIEDNFLKTSVYNTEKDNFVKNDEIQNIIGEKVRLLLSSYYDKTEVNDLLNSIKNLIISNSNLFYSKDIMDDKLALLETKVDSDNKKAELDTEIASIKGRFSDYPTTIDVEARLNSIQAGASGLNMDSFYNKTHVDTLLLKKVDLDVFNTFKSSLYTKTILDDKLDALVKKADYTTDINSIRGEITDIKTNGILGINPSNVVTTDVLNTTLVDYLRKDGLKSAIDLSLKSKLDLYVTNDKLTSELNKFKIGLSDLDNLTNYIDRNEFNVFKDSTYDKVYIDNIKNTFNDYTTTELLNSKLSEMNSRIKSDEDIINLTQSAGGKNYTKEKINELLSGKIDLVTLNNTVALKENEYNEKFATKEDLTGLYVTNVTFRTEVAKYLHLENGGTVNGHAIFKANTNFDDGITTNDLNMTNGDIRNIRSLTANGISNLNEINSSSINSTNIDVANNVNVKNIIFKTNGKLVLPQFSIKKDETFENATLDSYGITGSNLSVVVKENTPEFVLNVGLRGGNTLTSKMIKFNSDGSISTRNVKDLSFEGNWTKLALSSDLNLFKKDIIDNYVSSTELTTRLNSYQTKTDFSSSLANFYSRSDIDGKIKTINKNIEKIDIRQYVDQELNKRPNRAEVDSVKEDMVTGMSNRFTKEELNRIWKPQLMAEINNLLDDSWVSKSLLNTTLADYVTMSVLTPMLTQHGIDIMNNIGTNYVQINALNDRLKSYYLKTEINTKLESYTSKAELGTELAKYTNTEDMNRIHEGINTQITVANRLATTARSEINTVKDILSTNYFNKDDMSIEVNKLISKNVEPTYAKLTDLETFKAETTESLQGNKGNLEATLNSAKLALERKDTEQDATLEQHRLKFNDYVLTTKHNESVTNERSISDSKYLTKTEGSLLSKKSYVDAELLKKANLAGSIFTGDIEAPNIKGTTKIETPTINTTTVNVGKVNYNSPTLVEATSDIIIENNAKLLPINGSNSIGLFVGNKSSKTENESLGVFLRFDNNNISFQKALEETRGDVKYYKPDTKINVLANKEYVDNTINTTVESLKTGDIKNKVDEVSNKIDQTKSELEQRITTKLAEAMGTASGSVEQQVNTVTGKIEAAKTEITQNLEQNYTKLTKLNEEMQKIDTNIGNKVRELEPKFTQLQQTVTQTVTQDLTALETRMKQYVDNKVNQEINEVQQLFNRVVYGRNY